jgi:endonuclease III
MSNQQPPYPNWVTNAVAAAIAVGISWGIMQSRVDALNDRIARLEAWQVQAMVDSTRVTRLEEKLAAISDLLIDIRTELREHGRLTSVQKRPAK